jgi:hypothetical protein
VTALTQRPTAPPCAGRHPAEYRPQALKGAASSRRNSCKINNSFSAESWNFASRANQLGSPVRKDRAWRTRRSPKILGGPSFAFFAKGGLSQMRTACALAADFILPSAYVLLQ